MKIDNNFCMGCARCTMLYPNIAKIVDGKVTIISNEDSDTMADCCPAGAISK